MLCLFLWDTLIAIPDALCLKLCTIEMYMDEKTFCFMFHNYIQYFCWLYWTQCRLRLVSAVLPHFCFSTSSHSFKKLSRFTTGHYLGPLTQPPQGCGGFLWADVMHAIMWCMVATRQANWEMSFGVLSLDSEPFFSHRKANTALH